MSSIEDYYRDPAVRRQMVRFLGGETLEEATAAYLTAADGEYLQYEPRAVEQLDLFLRSGLDIGRSLWDSEILLAHFDIDYHNFTFPAEPYVDPERTFDLLQPVFEAARDELDACGIRALHLLSGCGHHLVWSIGRDSESFLALANLVPLPESLRGRYLEVHYPPGLAVGEAAGRAHAGLGVLLEYLCHRTLDRLRDSAAIPVELTAVRVGPGHRGAEIVSLDVSEYADPLHLRTIRVPFSVYLKARQRMDVLGQSVVESLPTMFLIPPTDLSLEQALNTMQSPARSAAHARRCDVSIPDRTSQTGSLIASYRVSGLHAFHRAFYDAEPEPLHRWPETYDAADLTHLPPCGRACLDRPCDLLMKPGHIRHLTRLLLAEGWHPRRIAGLIRSKYERDFDWGGYWYHYDATSRAEFYVRMFSGLIACDRDELVDFNCRSTQEKGYCSPGVCDGSLEKYREALHQRRHEHV